MTSIPILHDEDVDRLVDMAAAVSAVEDLLRAKRAGNAVTPVRHRVAFDPLTELVFTIGGTPGSIGGFRTYFSRNTRHHDDNVVAVWDMKVGNLKGIVLGPALGAMRMGAIGGAAMRGLSRPDARKVAIIGTGRQAATHAMAAAAVRPAEQVHVFGRSEARREAFAVRMSRQLGVPVVAAGSAQAAVEGADIVVLATTSLRPVIEAAWLAPGAFVHTVGFKSVGREMGLDVAERADLLVTDSPEQVAASGRTFVLHGTRHLDRLADLAEIVADGRHDADPSAIRVCYPIGLAGTDVVVADGILGRYVAAQTP